MRDECAKEIWIYESPRNGYVVGDTHPVLVCGRNQLHIYANGPDLFHVRKLPVGCGYTAYGGGRWFRAQ